MDPVERVASPRSATLASRAFDETEGLGHGVAVGSSVCMMCFMSSAELLHELQEAGWTIARIRGSHHVMKHPTHAGLVVLPHPKKDLGIGLVGAIRRQARLSEAP